MALNFGKTRTKKVKSELFPNDAVITLLPVDTQKEGRGAKKFQFNTKAIELMDLNRLDRATGERSNQEVSFIDETINEQGDQRYHMFVNTGDVKFKVNEEFKSMKWQSFKITQGDSSISSTDWYDKLVEYYKLDNTKANHFKLNGPNSHEETTAPLYELSVINEPIINSDKSANQIVEEANIEMAGMNVVIN